ncbi:MAG: DNA starvation/stationary phase protection protein [Pseudomonadales bacterium]|nr:DNA starvation/stationary phase protection protein [Pseudomonadales bacterium]
MTQPALKTYTTKMRTENGMLDGEKSEVAEVLRAALADTFSLMVAAQGVRWNVQGPLFYSIHKLTEEQYEEMFEAVDELAERIRALGFPAPVNVSSLVEPATVPEETFAREKGEILESQIDLLIEANEQIAKTLHKAAERIETLRDVRTSDILAERIGVHEQNAWMLRSIIS